MTSKLETTMERLGAIKSAAEDGFAYDQMLGFGDERGEELIMGAVDALIDQTRTIERVVGALDLENVEIEGSDSLDDPNAVFQ